MKLRNVRLKESLDLKDLLIEKIEKLGFEFGYGFNDLYKIKNGEVRRLKGMLFGIVDSEEVWYGKINKKDLNKYNKIFGKVKNEIEGKYGDYKVELNKRGKYDGCNKGREVKLILKISWKNN